MLNIIPALIYIGSSFKAINIADNSIIAVMLNCLHSNWSADHFYKLIPKCQSVELKQLFAIWAMIGQTSDLHKKYENCKVFEVNINKNYMNVCLYL